MSTETKAAGASLQTVLSEKRVKRPNSALVDMAAAIWAAFAARPDEPAQAPVPKAPPKRRAKGEKPIDFHYVPEHQHEIDTRLRNWGIWCTSRAASSSSPMFRLTPPTIVTRREYQNSSRAGNTVDRSDAIRIARAVTALPESHAAALNWCYVKPVSPRRAAESIGVSMEGLAALLIDARQMLINRPT